jgi:rod shape-determining protein MreB
VGWPKDHVARRMLGRDVVFGKDVMEQRLALQVIRPFEKGVLKYVAHQDAGVSEDKVVQYKEAASLLVQHAVSLTCPPQGARIHGVIGAPARASVENKQVLLEAAAKTFDTVAVVSEPFAVAYGMNCLTDALVVDIGAGTIDICPMYGTFPCEQDQLTMPVGGDAVDEEFSRLLRDKYPDLQLSSNMARQIKEKHGCVHDVVGKAQVTLPIAGKPQSIDVTEPLREACKILAQPIVKGIQDTIARFDPEFQDRLRKNIVLCGGGSQLKGLDTLIEAALQDYGGGRVTRVGDAVFAGAFGALKLAMGMPPEYWSHLKNLESVQAAA